MGIGVSMVKGLNHVFPKQVHPFNTQTDGTKSYAMWQYEKGADTIQYFLNAFSAEEMFQGKEVLDLGCGAGGKSLYYASLGAKKVTGMDIVPSYKEESEKLAKELNLEDKFQFILGSASESGLPDESFDTIIMNDFMEHISQPEKVLTESRRLLKKGGRIYLNFPPYYHPFGAHLSDVVNMPWVHMFFPESTLIKAYKDLVKDLPDGENRVRFRISAREDGKEYFSYINKMTIKRFRRILQSQRITPLYYAEAPLRGFLKVPAKTPGLKEMFVKMVVCVIEK